MAGDALRQPITRKYEKENTHPNCNGGSHCVRCLVLPPRPPTQMVNRDRPTRQLWLCDVGWRSGVRFQNLSGSDGRTRCETKMVGRIRCSMAQNTLESILLQEGGLQVR